MHSFEIESQIQYFSPLTIEQTSSADGTMVAEDQLKAFVNGAEWNLGKFPSLFWSSDGAKSPAASAVSQDPVLHFLLYVPSASKSPLLVQHDDGSVAPLTNFLIPRWGSIYVLSPPSSSSASVAGLDDLQAPFNAFERDLRSLLGMPALSGQVEAASDGIKQHWETQALMRQRVVQNVRDARVRLKAIAAQVAQIQNMRIPAAVQRDFNAALAALDQVSIQCGTTAVRPS